MDAETTLKNSIYGDALYRERLLSDYRAQVEGQAKAKHRKVRRWLAGGLVAVSMFFGAGLGAALVTPPDPTYHCDGSDTMGYVAPGEPEAAACWIEGAPAYSANR